MGKHRTFLFHGTRECICKLYSSGTNVSNIAKMLSIPRTTISTIIQKFKKSGSSQRKPQHGRKEKLSQRDQQTLGRIIGHDSRDMSGKTSLRIVESLEKARIEGDWASVSQYAEQLPREYQVLRFVSLGECLLEQRDRHATERNSEGSNSLHSLHLARDYISKNKSERDNQHYKEAILLQAKTYYIQGKFQECVDTFSKVNMEAMRKESLSFNVTKALADAYVYKGMSLEYLNTAYGNNSSSEEIIKEVISCYEAAGDIGLELLNSISKSTLKLTISGVLEIALIRSVLLQLSHDMVDDGINRLRKIFQLSDIPGSDQLRLSLALTLGEVLMQGVPEKSWTPTVLSRDTVTACDTLTKRGRNTPTQKKYESVFCPCNRVEETLLTLLISQALIYKDGIVSFHDEDKAEYLKTKRQVHRLLNMMVLLMSRYQKFRCLSDMLEKVLKFSQDDHHICVQFGLALISSNQHVRGAATLEKCLSRKKDVAIALVLAKTYINKLNRFEDTIKLCDQYLSDSNTSAIFKSRLYFLKGVAEGAMCRSLRLTLRNQQYSKSSITSLFQAYSLNTQCPQVLYHLSLRLAIMGEIKKSLRFTRKVLENHCISSMVDCSHLLVLVLSAQKRYEEALDMTMLTLLNYPDNLNLLISKVFLEKLVNGSNKALVTCKEVLLPLLEKLSSSDVNESAHLPYSDEWTGGKFQLSQWSDRISVNTTASYTGSNIGTIAGESISESVDSVVGCDQSNWGYQAEVWYTIADTFLSLGMIPDAQKCVDEIKCLFPLSHLVSYMSGKIQEQEGHLEEAEKQYINAVTLSPHHIPSLIALGKLQVEIDKPLLGEHNLTEATKLGVAEYEACHYLGKLYQQQGYPGKAAEYFMACLAFECAAPVRPYSVLKWTV